jgi:hypothetical protein
VSRGRKFVFPAVGSCLDIGRESISTAGGMRMGEGKDGGLKDGGMVGRRDEGWRDGTEREGMEG